MALRRLSSQYRLLAKSVFPPVRKLHHLYLQTARSKVFASLATGGTAFLYLTNTALCEEASFEEELEEADRLYSEHKFKELYEYLVELKGCDNHEVLWRVVRAHRDRATMIDVSAEEKKQLMFDALEISKRALELGEDNFACHKWYGIMLSETGDYLGTRSKLDFAPAMKEHFLKAVELCPSDATSHYLVGMWCYNFANLTWYERKIATVVFGTPPTSTYEEALMHFENAEEMSPSFYSANQYMLGLMHYNLGNKEEAKKWFEKLLGFYVKKDEDRENVKKAEDMLKSL